MFHSSVTCCRVFQIKLRKRFNDAKYRKFVIKAIQCVSTHSLIYKSIVELHELVKQQQVTAHSYECKTSATTGS